MANASFGFTSLLNMPFSAAKFITAAGAALGAFAASVSIAGISNTRVGPSTGGQAICATGLIRLNVTAENTKFNYAGPSNNSALTEFLVESLQSCSTLATRITQGPYTVSSEYGIYSKLCFPKQGAENVQTVQLLTHGGTLDHTYWDFSPGYSYVDAAAEAGYATFSYDRLGTGLSDHPDPIQVVQASIQVQVAHQLVQLLREGQVGNASFKHVVGVGHSLGTALTQGVTTRYPRDFDAVILTGTSTSFSAVPIGVASTAQQIASTDPSGRFTGLASGYIIPAPVPQSVQFAFYREPYFDPKIFAAQFQTRQTNAIGESLTLASVYTPSPGFTGPVDVVDGENDFFYCGGDCTCPTDQAAAVQPAFYPAAANGLPKLSGSQYRPQYQFPL